MINKHFLMIAYFIVTAALLITGCGPALAKNGDTVRVHYIGTFADGTEFDSSVGSEPLEFTIGEGDIIAGFEQAVIGMKVGDSKTVTIPADEAYGQRSDELVFEIGRDQLMPGIVPEVGMQLQAGQGSAATIVTIIGIKEATIILDANHPLAGQDLNFNIELVEIAGSGYSIVPIPLKEALASGKPTLAEFGSSTCAPCRQMKPILTELSKEYEGKVNIVIIEVYEERELTQEYRIMTIPTQIIFDSSGEEITRHIGFWSKEDILTQFKLMGIE